MAKSLYRNSITEGVGVGLDPRTVQPVASRPTVHAEWHIPSSRFDFEQVQKLFFCSVQTGSVTHTVFYPMLTHALTIQNSPLCNAEVKNTWSYTSIPRYVSLLNQTLSQGSPFGFCSGQTENVTGFSQGYLVFPSVSLHQRCRVMSPTVNAIYSYWYQAAASLNKH